MGLTNFPGGISSFGIPQMGAGIPTTFGTVYFVDYTNGSDGVSVKSNSLNRPFKTIDKALDTVTTNKNDVIALSAYSTHTLTEMLTVDKNRVHFIGLDCAGRMYGQGAKVSLGSTTAATDIGTILNTGVRNSFRNIKFSNSNDVAAGIYCFVDGGEYMYMEGCEVYKENDLDETGAAELVMNGDSSQLVNCTIGSLANAISGDVIRANVLFTKALAGAGKVARDVSFINCNFWKQASHVNNRYVYGAAATDIERLALFDGCKFIANKTSVAAPAQCVGFGATLTTGYVLMNNCVSIGNTKQSTTTGVYVNGAVPTAATSGIAVQGA